MADAPAKVYIQWNAINWITIVLMASFGALAFGFIMAGINAYGIGQRSASDGA